MAEFAPPGRYVRDYNDYAMEASGIEPRTHSGRVSVSPVEGATGPPEEPIQPGKVQQVCREWLVREDGVLAHRLQDQEINTHYEGNRAKHHMTRADFLRARALQISEEERLTMERLKAEALIDQQAKKDELVALEFQKRILEDERRKEEEKRAREQEDERLARKFQDKERKKLIRRRLEKELKEVEHIRTEKIYDLTSTADDQQQQRNIPPSSSAYASGTDPDFTNLTRTLERMKVDDSTKRYITMRFDHLREMDLSEFCQPPPPGLTPEELRIFYEQQDEELAQFLQEQETRSASSGRSGRKPVRDKRALIEQQDYEIAKLLQEQENEKARRLKEKARLKKQRSRELQEQNYPSYHRSSASGREGRCSAEQTTYQTQQSTGNINVTSVKASYAAMQQQRGRYTPNDDSEEEQEEDGAWLHEPLYDRVPDTPSPVRESPLPTDNIAVHLDPTYKKHRTVREDGTMVSSNSSSTHASSSTSRHTPENVLNISDEPQEASRPPAPYLSPHFAAPAHATLDDMDDPTTLHRATSKQKPQSPIYSKVSHHQANGHTALKQRVSHPEPTGVRSSDQMPVRETMSSPSQHGEFSSWACQPIPGQRRSSTSRDSMTNSNSSSGQQTFNPDLLPQRDSGSWNHLLHPPVPNKNQHNSNNTPPKKTAQPSRHSRDGCKTQ